MVVTDVDERRRTAWDVAATIYVNRPSQKAIVIGPGGSLVKAVRMSAEPELSDIFGVRVRHWMKNNRILAEMGYLGSRQ